MQCALTALRESCSCKAQTYRLLKLTPAVSGLKRLSSRYSMQAGGPLSDTAASLTPGCTVAVAQLNSTNNAEDAGAQQCRMLFLPECFAFMASSSDEALSQAEALSGPLMQQYCNLARSNKMWLSLGGFHEKSETGKMFNTHVIVSSEGNIMARYRKIHLFDVDIPGGPCLKESRLTVPGTEVVTCDTPAGRLGLSVCYDLRFPHLYQRLVTEGGAQILLVPSAFTKTTGNAHWHALLRARAIENQAFVIAAAQTGRHNNKRESFGCSLVVSPWGEILAEIAPEDTGIAIVHIDLSEILETQAKMPVQQHKEAASAAVSSPIVQYPSTQA